MYRPPFYCIWYYFRSYQDAVQLQDKTTQQSWTSEAINGAVLAVKRDKMPFATAAKQFNVPGNTLKRRALDKNQDATDDKKILGKYKKVFTDEQELELCVQYISLKWNDVSTVFHKTTYAIWRTISL